MEADLNKEGSKGFAFGKWAEYHLDDIQSYSLE
jgi:hypothetical protein